MEETNNTPEVKEEKKSNKFAALILRHKFVSLLLVVIAALVIYHLITINSIESKYEEAKTNIIKEYTTKIDSIKISNVQQVVNVFSWAVRSELMRNNLEQVDQFFLTFVKDNNVRRVDLINPETSTIILSTDKKNEGIVTENRNILLVEDIKVIQDSVNISVVAPVMGLNKKIGILNVEIIK